MAGMMKRVLALVATAAMLVALIALVPASSSAANLTGGQTTYVIDGEEVTFAFDPIRLAGGTLLPLEVYQHFGIQVEGALAQNVSLKKADVTVRLALKTGLIQVENETLSSAVAPMRLNGRLFVPADLLRYFGVEFTQDGSYALMRQYVPGMPTVMKIEESEYNSLLIGRRFEASIKADSGIFLYGNFTLLTPEMVSAEQFELAYGTRARLQNLLQTNTLILVDVRNTSAKTGAIAPGTLFLVDNQHNQYDLVSMLDIGRGLLSNKLAPAASRAGVLVFPKVAANLENLILYSDSNGASLGTYTRVN